MEAQGLPLELSSEGLLPRYQEFRDFEDSFASCLSKSAVRTKFAQHSNRGQQVRTHFGSDEHSPNRIRVGVLMSQVKKKCFWSKVFVVEATGEKFQLLWFSKFISGNDPEQRFASALILATRACLLATSFN